MRGSAMTFAQASSRAAFVGHSTQEKTIVSPSSALAARLKSVTGGQGSWTMQLSHYEPAPPNLQQQLATEYKKSRKQEED